jgi:hypothetical protein
VINGALREFLLQPRLLSGRDPSRAAVVRAIPVLPGSPQAPASSRFRTAATLPSRPPRRPARLSILAVA